MAIVGGENVIGTATVLITADTAAFDKQVEARTGAVFGGLGKRAEKAGEESGRRMGAGFSKGSGAFKQTLTGLGVPLAAFDSHVGRTAAGLGKLDSEAKGVAGTMATLGGRALLGGAAALVAVGAAGVKAALGLEKARTEIGAAAAISDEAAGQITDAFHAMGKTVFTASELGGAYATVAGELGSIRNRALNAAESVKVMAAAQMLAQATGGDLTRTTEALGGIMQVYKLRSDQAAHATDILFTAARESGTHLEELAATITRVKGRLGVLAPSLGETAGFVDDLAKQGIKGRLVMGALSAAFGTLIKPSEKTKQVAHELGLEIFDLHTHKFVGLESVIRQLQPKLVGLSPQMRLLATEALFGGTANKQLLGIIQQGPAAFHHATVAVERHNAVAHAAAERAKSLDEKWRHAMVGAKELAVEVGKWLIPKLERTIAVTREVIAWFGHHAAVAKGLAAVITGVLGAAISVFVFQKVKALVLGVREMIGAFIAFGGKVAATVGLVATEESALVTTNAATAAKVTLSNEATAGSFKLIAGSASTTTATVATSEAALAADVTATDETIVAANRAAAGSWTAMLGPIFAVTAAAVALKGPFGELEKTAFFQKVFGSSLGANPSAGFNSPAARKFMEEAVVGSGVKQENLGAASNRRGVRPERSTAVTEAARHYHIDPKVLFGIFGTETNFGQNIKTSSTGAQGAFQFEPATAAQYHYPLTNTPNAKQFAQQAAAAAHYLHDLIKEFHGNVKRAISAYNAGPAGGVQAAYTESVLRNAGLLNKHSKALEEGLQSILEPTKKAKGRKAAAEAYVSPFASPGAISRVDQGVDFAAHPGEAVKAIGAGVIDAIVKGWYKGQSLIEEKLTSGSRKGQYVYYAEQLTPGVAKGQAVKAGQEIARVAARGTGLELGFGAGGGRTLAMATTGYKEGQITPAGRDFQKFLGQLGKGGSALSVASQTFAELAKRELARLASDKKAGEGWLNKTLAAIQSGGVKELSKVVGGAHERGFRDLLKRLHDDHVSGLDKLRATLAKVHKQALEALAKALLAAAEKVATEKLDREDRIKTDEADATAQAIGDNARIALDRAAEAGKTGAALVAAQARSHFDELKAADDAAIAAARLAVDQATGSGELAEAEARARLVGAENAAKIAEANAQAALDLADEAAAKAEAAKTSTEQTVTNHQPITIYINGTGLDPSQLMAEVGWALKTGAVPPPLSPAPATISAPPVRR